MRFWTSAILSCSSNYRCLRPFFSQNITRFILLPSLTIKSEPAIMPAAGCHATIEFIYDRLFSLTDCTSPSSLGSLFEGLRNMPSIWSRVWHFLPLFVWKLMAKKEPSAFQLKVGFILSHSSDSESSRGTSLMRSNSMSNWMMVLFLVTM